jgi:hypothetical protein
MRKGCLALPLLAASLSALQPTTLCAAKPWELLSPFKRVEADPDKAYRLTEDHGPWMILATSFAGPGAEKQAHNLVLELRKQYNLPTYLHRQTYDFTDRFAGLGLDRYGNPKTMRYYNEKKFDEIAVLVGHFESVDDSRIDKTRDKIRYARPNCLDVSKNHSTTQRFFGLRELQRRLTPDKDKRERGPMGKAFVTRNPLLPQQYFTPGGLDPFVERMNRNVQYSLLKNPGRYTVRVATFRGSTTMNLDEMKQVDNKRPTGKLEEAAVKAHELTMALRRQGVDAYEFHDRYESIVTVGSFDSYGTPRPDGKTEIHPRIYQIMRSYGAQRKKLPGMTSLGLVPRAVNGIPLDVQPMPVEVPKTSIATAYAPSNRLFQ